ncbi:Glucan endo-1,3-beta-glucosidase A1 [Cyphellophora attinorum]|uniref:Glucan endo-1,3-beta-glucosidase A1 n=1 Tax=Cyphellophora attinorum TaxID=1664694 RepID=A0A0N1HNV9_9EURO|nr:Glucan endo-1,3-beta-glucosidase A1 [Phialophora attinorum]KPI36816.1 Glucan endo-1,3-beta-glucosidase A1 [Phialophora attinorum]
MGLLESLEKKGRAAFDQIKREIGMGDNKQQQQSYPGYQQQSYPGYQQQQSYPGNQQQGYQGYQQQQQQQQNWGPPQQHQQWAPPPPNHTKPPPQAQSAATPQQPQSGNPTDYWVPILHSSRSVATDFDHKLGNTDGWGNNELQHYTNLPQNSFYTPDHKLVLRAISHPSDPNPATKYTSARLVTRQRLDRPRGCLTATISNPSAPGIWPAFWLLPAEPFQWPNEGEVDVGESWNGDPTNHTCLHWGHFNGADSQKHRVIDTPIHDLGRRPIKYEFAWEQDDATGRGRYLWWIDGRPVMKASIPDGFRRMQEWTVLLNIAMGGNVCQGKTPAEGSYDMVVHELRMSGECDGGWGRFEGDWWRAKEGRTM